MTYDQLPIPEGYVRVTGGVMEYTDLLGWTGMPANLGDPWYEVTTWAGRIIDYPRHIILRKVEDMENENNSSEEWNT